MPQPQLGQQHPKHQLLHRQLSLDFIVDTHPQLIPPMRTILHAK